jgi:hypothetical protein
MRLGINTILWVIVMARLTGASTVQPRQQLDRTNQEFKLGTACLHMLDSLGEVVLKARSRGRSRTVPTSVCGVHVIDMPGTGTGPTVFLLHGITSRASDQGPLALGLAEHAKRVIAVDLPGDA